MIRCFIIFAVAVAATIEAQEPQTRMQDVAFTATADGTTQRYVLLAPEDFQPKTDVDLLIALHGHGSDRWQFAKDPRDECRAARDVAAEHSMLFVSPDYRATTSWMGPLAEADLRQIIGELRRQYRIRRVFLTGGSMGGTSALTFAVLHPELLAGVAAMNPHANHVEYGNFQEAITASFGGTKAEVPEEYRKRSAELHADRLTMPVAITVSGRDTSVPPDSARRLAAALAERQHPVLLIDRPELGHLTEYHDARTIIEYVIAHARED